MKTKSENDFQKLVAQHADTLVSVPFGSPLLDHLGHLPGSHLEIRSSDWGLSGCKSIWFHIRAAVRTAWRARKHRSLLFCTANIENFVLAQLSPYILRGCEVRLYDPLIPSSMKVRSRLGSTLNQVDEIIVIRTGDKKTIRHSLAAKQVPIQFSSFPAPSLPKAIEIADEGYLYSGGAAHRDWDTLAEALEGLDIPCKIRMCEPQKWKGPRGPHMDIAANPPPHEARKLAAKARVIVVCMKDTDLPSGPLVLLDALQLGKSVIVTDVNGTRDYIAGPDLPAEIYRVTPGEPTALQTAIHSSWNKKPIPVEQ